MLKLKIRLSFRYFIYFFLVVPLYSQGIFNNSTSKDIFSISSEYSKHINLNDYSFGFVFGLLWNNDIQLDLNYLKNNKYNGSISSGSDWEESNSVAITKFFNKRKLNYSLSLKMSDTKRSNISSTSFLFRVNSSFLAIFSFISPDISYLQVYFKRPL